MNNELFELCKDVYERTGWTNTLQCIWNGKVSMPEQSVIDYGIKSKYPDYAPLYTSDYLLEKLNGKAIQLAKVLNTKDGWFAVDTLSSKIDHQVQAETPLKALLKLAIALHEAGELK